MVEILGELFYGKDSYYKNEYRFSNNDDELKFHVDFRFMPKMKSFDAYYKSMLERFENDPKYMQLIKDDEPYIHFKPYTLKEIENITFPSKHVIFELIDPRFYNKKFTVGDYTIHVQYEKEFKPLDISEVTEEWKHDNKSKSIRNTQSVEDVWCIILEYHGIYKMLGRVRILDYLTLDYINNAQFGNWWVDAKDFDDEQRIIIKQHKRELTYKDFNELLLSLFKKCPKDIELSDSEIEFQEYYDSNTKKKLSEYDRPDYEWFIRLNLNNGVYTPDLASIYYVFGSKKKPDKNLLKNLGIKTVQLRAKEHFDIASYFNMDGINIKAPKNVITKYGYEKYLDNDKMLNSIKKDKEEQKRKEDLAKYNDTFTLMFHGKEIMVNCSSADIIEHLQNKSVENTEQLILDSFKVIFDKFKEIDKYELCTYGTYYAYELAGESHYNVERDNDHISEDILKQIDELYSDYLMIPDEEYLRLTYGRVERGAILVGVRRNGKGLEIYTEDYDLC